ncbi:histidinol-phosphate aminotransferase [Bacillus sp. FJAT-27231]|uniref:histidinol-phosphate transaminase n=1 Tax=Bacillus sp. FJAT-27231 TaxID=1679168 RepID=UPI000670DC53|nr:histidinol-phosphate transaminase [Bacillus sp. FJAT-27231]KMY54014.1 histidinol-phosphate aminotransferase [Bacillus sp. FJAT-27231]
MSENLWRSHVRDLDPYIPGQAAEEAKKQEKVTDIIRLATNENQLGPSPKAIEAMVKAIQEAHFYPDLTCLELRTKLGELHGIDPENYVVANGADNIINLVIASYVNSGDEVVYCTPTFSEYHKNTLLMGGVPVEIPTTKDHKFDLKAMLEAITEKTKVVIVCNPNNPTGTIVDEEDLRAFFNRLPKHVVAVLDEAYGEFITRENYPTGVEYIKEGLSVITIRTFSKLYGLAGMRVGYAMASQELIQPLQRVREPFACNRVAHAGALGALEDIEHKHKTLAENKHEMEKLVKEFHSLGYEVEASHTNFLFVDMKKETDSIAEELASRGLIIRPCAAWGYPTYARISIGTTSQNDKLVKALQEINAKAPHHI